MHAKTQIRFLTALTFLVMSLASAEISKSSASILDLSLLQKLRSSPNIDARMQIVLTLEKTISESSRKTLEVIALDTKEVDEVRMQAICSLGNIANHESLPVLLNILEDDIKQRRGFWACVIPVLANLKDRRAIPLLIRVANLREDSLAGMDHMAIEALAEIGDEREILLLASKAYIVPVRLAVMKGLARIGSVESTEVLTEGLQGAEEPEIVKVAQRGILKIGKAAVPILESLLIEFPKGWDEQYRTRLQTLILKIQQKVKPSH